MIVSDVFNEVCYLKSIVSLDKYSKPVYSAGVEHDCVTSSLEALLNSAQGVETSESAIVYVNGDVVVSVNDVISISVNGEFVDRTILNVRKVKHNGVVEVTRVEC